MLPHPVTLANLRQREAPIRRAIEDTEWNVSGTIYRPFELSEKRPLRVTQHYLTKLPLAVILEIPELVRAADEAGNPGSNRFDTPPTVPEAPPDGTALGQGYVAANEATATPARDPFTIDPSVIDRGVRGHAATQNALAATLRARGFEPRSPQPREPQYDVAWTADGQINVAEVKSLTTENEERQLRLGLGQVLRYRHLLGAGRPGRAVLVVERAPTDLSWIELCIELGVLLCWPPEFEGL